MAAEGLKWRVNRAVQQSTLPPPARLTMFVLSDRADARTAEIPEDRTPSLAELAEWTGLGVATVKRHLAALEAGGWLRRMRPSASARAAHVSTRYRLSLPGSSTPASDSSERAIADSSERAIADSSERAIESESMAQSEPTPGSERAIAMAQSEPSSYYYEDNDQLHDQKTAADAAADEPDALFPPPPETAPPDSDAKPPKAAKPRTAADELTDAFWKIHGKTQAQSWVAVRGIVRTALANGLPRDDVARALDRIARDKRAISGGAITTALGQLRAPTQQANGHTPWRNPTDPSVYYEAL